MSEQIKDAAATPAVQLTVVDKLRMLLDITKKISRSLNVDEVLELVMDTLGSLIPYDAAGIYIVERHPETKDGSDDALGALKGFSTTSVRGYDINELTGLYLKVGEGLLGYAAQTGEPLIVHDVSLDPRYVNARAETCSEMVAPIISNDEVIGAFDLESDRKNAYTQDDLEILMLLASQVAIIIEKAMLHEQLVEKRRLQAQLEVARHVQLELLPSRDPDLEGFDISAYNFSTEEVSGDYYDFVSLYEDHLGIVIADVSGKGVPAALLMAFLRASLRAAIHIGYAPNISMAKVNYLLWESIENNQYVTAFYGVLDATNKTLAYANAGHNPPLLMDSEGNARFIERGGIPLGMFRDTRYYEYYLPILPGQTIVLYTDGITEAADAAGVEYGRDRLERKVREGREKTARELIDFLHADVLEWT
ncbi:MAG TPA: GAF domain-containing SpoIIE family protein phosphatase, partial [Pyrinomonadaceae bacterium]|nr:GAF domain-containing SpoIIE family protein phosphatase [Pyrinomonadaceae bacterium]